MYVAGWVDMGERERDGVNMHSGVNEWAWVHLGHAGMERDQLVDDGEEGVQVLDLCACVSLCWCVYVS
jgi:hypothetical protein